MARPDPTGTEWEMSITVFEVPYEEADKLFDFLTEQVCEFYGGHAPPPHSVPAECPTYFDGCWCAECPVQFIAGMKPHKSEEEE